MKLRPLLAATAALALADLLLAWRGRAGRSGPPDGLVDRPLVEAPVLEGARRVVVREKPESRTLYADDNGSSVQVLVAPNAPVRETVLERDAAGPWRVANCFGLPADPTWLGQTMRDLARARLVRRVTGDPSLMGDLGFEGTSVLFQDGAGRELTSLEFGRKDGADAYAFVRVDRGAAFLARDSAEIVGDPLAWISSRVAAAAPADVRVLAWERQKGERLEVIRPGPGRPFRLGDQAVPGAERLLGAILASPVMLVVGPESVPARSARLHPLGRVSLELFDGRRYEIAYGAAGADAAGAGELEGDSPNALAFAVYGCSEADDPVAEAGKRAVFAYGRGGSVGRLPASRAELLRLP